MSWRVAKALETLRSQINAAHPGRSKASDGTIGDAAHASRNSDHNPWVKDGATGVVTALDITHDPANGVDIQRLADALVASRDDRIKYIIANGRIVSGTGQKQPAWQWRNYTGSNQHTRHIHVSVKSTKAAYDSTAPWTISGVAGGKVTPSQSVLKNGSRGPFVAELQRNLNTTGFGPLKDDGIYGAQTEAAVKAFQRKVGLKDDGWTGPRTLEAMGMAIAALRTQPKIEALEAVPEAVEQKVKEKSNWLTWLTGGGGSGLIGLGWLSGMNADAIIAGGVVLIVVILILVLLRSQIISAVRDIKSEIG